MFATIVCSSQIIAEKESDIKISTQGDKPQIGEVVVIATRTEKFVSEVPCSVTVITADDIKKSTPQTIADIFRDIQGVQVQGGGTPGMPIRLSLRGLTIGHNAQHTLVLIDGRRINDAYEGDVDASLLSFDAIERIEILRGPASALYGSNATGGVINIITKRGTKKPFTEISISGGEYNTQHYTVRHGWKMGGFDYFATLSRFLTDGYLKNSDGSRRDWEASSADINTGVTMNDGSELRFFLGGYIGEGTDEASERKITRDYQALSYARRWNKDLNARLNVKVYRNGEERKYEWKGGFPGIYNYQTAGVDVQQSLLPGNAHQATVGIEARGDSVDIDDISNPVGEKTDGLFAVYVQDEIFIEDGIRLTIGVRGDHANNLGTKISPRAGIVYSVSSDVEFFGSASLAYRAPAISHRYTRIEWMGMLFEGNPDLEPETMTAYEIGMRGRWMNNFQMELSAFFLSLDKGFDFMMFPDGVFRAQNVAQTEINGIETSARYGVFNWLNVYGTYTFTDGEYKYNPGNPAIEGNVPEYLAKHQGAIGIELTGLGGTHLISARYAGPRFADAMNTEERKLDSYLVGDVASHIPVSGNVELTLKVQNITNRDYYEYPWGKQPGRSVYGGVSVSF